MRFIKNLFIRKCKENCGAQYKELEKIIREWDKNNSNEEKFKLPGYEYPQFVRMGQINNLSAKIYSIANDKISEEED